MKAISFIRECLKTSFKKSIDDTIKTLEELLDSGSEKYNDLVSLQVRLKNLDQDFIRGIISDESTQRERNRIHAALIDLIDKIEAFDIEGNTSDENNITGKKNFEAEQEILDAFNSLWSLEEDFIKRLFKEALTFTNKAELKAFIQRKTKEFSQGRPYGTIYPAPSDFTMTLIHTSKEKGFFYHPSPRQIGVRKDHRENYRKVLEIKNGTYIWINEKSTREYREAYALAERTGRNPNYGTVSRITKMYFQEIPGLDLILTFEDHVNLRSRIPKGKHLFTKIYLAFRRR